MPPGALTEKLLSGPLEVVIGLSYGLVVGVLLWFLPGAANSRLSLLRLLLLTCAGLMALFGSQKVRGRERPAGTEGGQTAVRFGD